MAVAKETDEESFETGVVKVRQIEVSDLFNAGCGDGVEIILFFSKTVSDKFFEMKENVVVMGVA